jgi:hypothetical protein
VKILLDESVPRLLKLRLPHLDISTVQEMGWGECGMASCCDEPRNSSISLSRPIRTSDINKACQAERLRSSATQQPGTSCRSTRADNRSAVDDDSTGNGSGFAVKLAARERSQPAQRERILTRSHFPARGGGVRFIWFIWSVGFLWFVWFRERNNRDKPDRPNKPATLPLNRPALTQDFQNTFIGSLWWTSAVVVRARDR